MKNYHKPKMKAGVYLSIVATIVIMLIIVPFASAGFDVVNNNNQNDQYAPERQEKDCGCMEIEEGQSISERDGDHCEDIASSGHLICKNGKAYVMIWDNTGHHLLRMPSCDSYCQRLAFEIEDITFFMSYINLDVTP